MHRSAEEDAPKRRNRWASPPERSDCMGVAAQGECGQCTDGLASWPRMAQVPFLPSSSTERWRRRWAASAIQDCRSPGLSKSRSGKWTDRDAPKCGRIAPKRGQNAPKRGQDAQETRRSRVGTRELRRSAGSCAGAQAEAQASRSGERADEEIDPDQQIRRSMRLIGDRRNLGVAPGRGRSAIRIDGISMGKRMGCVRPQGEIEGGAGRQE